MSGYCIYKIETVDRITKKKYSKQTWSFDTEKNLKDQYSSFADRSPNLMTEVTILPEDAFGSFTVEFYCDTFVRNVISNYQVKALIKNLVLLKQAYPKARYFIYLNSINFKKRIYNFNDYHFY